MAGEASVTFHNLPEGSNNKKCKNLQIFLVLHRTVSFRNIKTYLFYHGFEARVGKSGRI
jgi:hypothetical protein